LVLLSEVILILHLFQIHLVLARSRNTVHVSPDIKANINVFLFTKYYLGGIPPSLREQ